mgnify:CR=1 FL=1
MNRIVSPLLLVTAALATGAHAQTPKAIVGLDAQPAP